MIQLLNIALAFGGQRVLDGLTWTIKTDQQRIGLIGPNGAGKSTLLRLVAGRQQPDAGTVSISGSTTVGYLEQDVQDGPAGQTVRAAALEAFGEVQALEAEEHAITRALDAEPDHESAHYLDLLHRLEEVQAQLVAHEAHLLQPRTEAVLMGLGFEVDDLERPLHTFSGGWRMRVVLAKLLLRQPDVLLLDEPTNHLDIESIDWLETYLKSYHGTVVIVSHDRYFLDRMVTSIAELAGGQITEYAGNYAFYLEEREERRVLQRAAYENQQREIVQIERFIERFRYKATKAKQVQSRIKQLEKMERIALPPSEQAPISFRFPEPRRSGRAVLELSPFSKTYAGEQGPIRVFERAGPLTLERGDKVALIGKNGAGKSTLARILRGTEAFDGTRALGHHVSLTYFAQHQAESLNPEHTILDAVRAEATGQSDVELRTLLGAFLFTGDDVFKKTKVLSGGERSRVALARTLLFPANFLILDEPTNHLDIQSIHVLIEALRQYTGSFVIVSHDRYFLDQVANKVWHVGGGRVRAFPGTYSEYRWSLERGSAEAPVAAMNGTSGKPAPASETKRSSGPKSKAQKRREAEERSRRTAPQNGDEAPAAALSPRQLRRTYETTEAAILEKEEQRTELEARLADPALYEDSDRAQAVQASYRALQDELQGLYAQWEDLAEHLAAQEA